MLTTRFPAQQGCPHCKKQLDAASSVKGDHVPRVGDLTVCIDCTTVLTWEVGMVLRPITDDELRKLPEEVLFDVLMTQTMIRAVNGRRRRANFRNN